MRVTTTAAGALNAKGTIRAVAGTYYAFGQRLDIDRGQLLFDGPANNPALDVVALRKNLAVEAGIELTGTVKVPRVRLVSNPPVPDNEKLSWLLTGQGLDRANRADLAALSAASASLLGQGENRSRRRSPTRWDWTTSRCVKRIVHRQPGRPDRWSRSASASPTGCRSCTSKG